MGDLADASAFPPNTFDAIYCSFVLEHVPDAGLVMDNFARWLRPGGVIIINIPDHRSVYGFITRTTPHWVHVLYKRWFTPLGKRSGKPGFGPYRTFYDGALTELGERFGRYGMEVVDPVGFGTLPKHQQSFAEAIAAASFGYLSAKHMDLHYVIRHPAQPAEPKQS